MPLEGMPCTFIKYLECRMLIKLLNRMWNYFIFFSSCFTINTNNMQQKLFAIRDFKINCFYIVLHLHIIQNNVVSSTKGNCIIANSENNFALLLFLWRHNDTRSNSLFLYTFCMYFVYKMRLQIPFIQKPVSQQPW